VSDRCRSCDAPLLWAVTPAGRRIPLDPEPDQERGNMMLATGRQGPLAIMLEGLNENARPARPPADK
jgi:hypothetical protein